MYQKHTISAVILIGGKGTRFAPHNPKQFHHLKDRPIYLHTLESFLASQFFNEIILVCHHNWINTVEKEIDKLKQKNIIKIVKGGATRQESSYKGLQALRYRDIVMIHDGVRPFVSQRMIQENIDMAIRYGAVNTCIPVTDTLVQTLDGKSIQNIPQRNQFYRGQTPQTFSFEVIWQAHQRALQSGIKNATEDCQLALAMNHPVHMIIGDEKNIKITSTLDLYLAEKIYRFQLEALEARSENET